MGSRSSKVDAGLVLDFSKYTPEIQEELKSYVNLYKNVCVSLRDNCRVGVSAQEAVRRLFSQMMQEDKVDREDLVEWKNEKEKAQQAKAVKEEAELAGLDEIEKKKKREAKDQKLAQSIMESQEEEQRAGYSSEDCPEEQLKTTNTTEEKNKNPRNEIRKMELRMSSGAAENAACPVCFTDYDDTEGSTRVKMSSCGHVASCADCFAQYLKIRIKEHDVSPWIKCPTSGCSKPVHPDDLFQSSLKDVDFFAFLQVLMDKRLHQESAWGTCSGAGCHFGFLFFDQKQIKKKKATVVCEVCGKKQSPVTIMQKGPNSDAEYQSLVKEGKLRPCPKCGYMAMKDYGICNIIQCGHCSIWWNWRTRQTGQTKQKLKEQARNEGSLWEPGELEFQQTLERTDKEGFKKLLEENGIQYNPNYVRGR